jgi:hypothetical protein
MAAFHVPRPRRLIDHLLLAGKHQHNIHSLEELSVKESRAPHVICEEMYKERGIELRTEVLQERRGRAVPGSSINAPQSTLIYKLEIGCQFWPHNIDEPN